ncbi:hypothetical protein [Desulfonatronum sp. SC1]|uniref:hypothetical protein n=1 Tax=Desulfonatronum sp. SC1 TaxID=2109626 RepID=UPI000D3282D8|nr:hypothetical protein [Desulfonatronum sp. SC1]PTN33933.1 hypothetical protein C6366_13680 [Desulfonatronum sp. SC1]
MRFHPRFSIKFLLHPAPAALVLLALITAFISAPTSANQTDDPKVVAPEFIPLSIAGMTLINLLDGAEAAKIIDRMHHGDVATQANFIAKYQGAPGSATYYVSLYDDPQRAMKDMEEMGRIMGKEGHGFSHLMRRTREEIPFYMALGQGQAHYFFVRDIELIWLAVDVDIAEQALEEILQ